MSDTIAYVVGGDSWIPAYVSIYSLLYNNPTRDFKIHIVSEEEKDDFFFNNISFYDSVHNNFKINFNQITEREYNKLPSPKKDRLPKGYFAKVLLPDLIDTNDESLLYMDADTLIVDKIEPLMQKDMNACVVAAAPDYKNLIAGLDVSLKKRYFNAGVLRINVKMWRKYNITSKALEYVQKKNPYLDDQTALNAVLHQLDMVKIISPRYNLSRSWALGENVVSGDRTKDSVVDDPCIIHYYQYGKPWNHSENLVYDEIWKKYYAETPHDGLLENEPKAKKFLRIVKKYIE
jgi:lipopolysaccharide biosynthesis glycosyltransferase